MCAQYTECVVRSILSRSSRAFTYPRFGPLFLRISSYAQSWLSLLHVEQLGLFPSHFNFLFLHITHAILLAAGVAPAPVLVLSAVGDILLSCGGGLLRRLLEL